MAMESLLWNGIYKNMKKTYYLLNITNDAWLMKWQNYLIIVLTLLVTSCGTIFNKTFNF